MKKLLKIGALGLALVISLLMLNNTKAASDSGKLQLEITGGSNTCVYGTALNLGTHAPSYAAFNMTGIFTGSNTTSTRYCADNKGLTAAWNLNISTTDLTNATSQTIASGNVFMHADTHAVRAGSGTCTAGASDITGTWASIGQGSPKVVLKKNTTTGEVCTIQTTNVQLAVQVPANQAVGLYTGTITVTLPINF